MGKDLEVMIEIYSKIQNNKATEEDKALFDYLFNRSCLREDALLLKLDNEFNLKVGYLWKHQPFKQRPTYNGKFVKLFRVYYQNELIIEGENWGSILAQSQQFIKDNAKDFYDTYNKLNIFGFCKSENIEFKIVDFDILETKWY